MESDTDTQQANASPGFEVKELDKLVRQIVDKVRGNYYSNGETGRGIPGEVKKIIDNNVDRL